MFHFWSFIWGEKATTPQAQLESVGGSVPAPKNDPGSQVGKVSMF